MITEFFRFWYSTKPFQININIKTKKTLSKVTLYLKQPDTWKTNKFYKTPQNLQSLGRFLVTFPFPTPESFLPPYERLYFAKLQKDLIHLESWSNDWQLKFTTDKWEAMRISKRMVTQVLNTIFVVTSWKLYLKLRISESI